MKITPVLVLVPILGACAHPVGSQQEGTLDPQLTPEQEAAYEKCLQENMAVATAWELIEEQCRKAVMSDSDDPLGAR